MARNSGLAGQVFAYGLMRLIHPDPRSGYDERSSQCSDELLVPHSIFGISDCGRERPVLTSTTGWNGHKARAHR
jgi:hypothetical protein